MDPHQQNQATTTPSELIDSIHRMHVLVVDDSRTLRMLLIRELNAIGIVAQRLKREFSPAEDQQDYEALTGTMVSEIARINRSLQDFLEYTRPTPLNIASLKIGSQDLN